MPFETRRPAIADMVVPLGLFVRILARGVSDQEIRRECGHLKPRDLQTLLAYAHGLPDDLAARFHLLMHDGFWVVGNVTKATKGKGYWARYQLRSVRNHGGLEAAKHYLDAPFAQDGFDRMRELDLMDFSIEAIVLQAPWSRLFTRQELANARTRLATVGYRPSAPPNPTDDLPAPSA